MIEPNDNDGHVIARIFSISVHRFSTAHVQDLFTELAEDQFVSLIGVRAESLTDVVDHVGVAHGIPDTVSGNDDEFPLTVYVEGLYLRNGTDHLLPGGLFMFGLEEKVTEASGRDEDTANSEKKISKASFPFARILALVICWKNQDLS